MRVRPAESTRGSSWAISRVISCDIGVLVRSAAMYVSGSAFFFLRNPNMPPHVTGSAGGYILGGMSETPEPSTIAVVSAALSDGPLAIWHVQLAPQLTGDRLSGAWLVETGDVGSVLRNLFTGTAVLVVGDGAGAEPDVVKQAREAVGARRMDPAATTEALRAHVAELKARVEEEKAKPGREKLTTPRFPAVDDIEAIDFPHVGEEAAGPPLAWARGLEELTATWAEIESQRRRRDYLQDPWGAAARPLPLAYLGD